MKTTKTNGKVGFEVCTIVASFLVQHLGKGYRADGLIQACESNLNDFKSVKSESKYGSVTAKVKSGVAAMNRQTSETLENKLDNVSRFMGWHDAIEKTSAKLAKLGAMVTVTSLPEGCQFAEWLQGFAVKPEPANRKNGKPEPAKSEAAPAS